MNEQSLILHDPAEGAVSALPDAVALKMAVLEECAIIGEIKTSAQQTNAVASWSKLKRLRADLEKTRKALTLPHLERQREIKRIADEFDADLLAENDRIDAAVTAFQLAEQEKVREAERARLRELQRIENERLAELARIEAERVARERAAQEERDRIARAEAEAKRIAAQAEAEAQRKAAEAAHGLKKKEREALEAKNRQEAEERRLAAAKEQERLAAERKALEEKEALANAETKRQQEREAELAALRVQVAGPVAQSTQAKGQISRVEYDHEIFDIHLVYKNHPGFVTLTENRAEIKRAIAMGTRNIPGLRIFEVMKNKIRAARTVPAIDVPSVVVNGPANGQLL